jgi:hypothetical protein
MVVTFDFDPNIFPIYERINEEGHIYMLLHLWLKGKEGRME